MYWSACWVAPACCGYLQIQRAFGNPVGRFISQ